MRGHPTAEPGGNSQASVEMRYEDENIWLTQQMMATLYDVSVSAINQHLKRIFSDNKLEESSVVKQYLTTAADGKCYASGHGPLLGPGEPAGGVGRAGSMCQPVDRY